MDELLQMLGGIVLPMMKGSLDEKGAAGSRIKKWRKS